MKYLLVLTTLCAMVLAIGRGAAGGGFWAESSFWQELTSAVPEFVGLALLALFPTLIIPLLAISGRPSLRTIIMFPFLWAGLTYLAVEVESIDNTSPLSKLAWDIVLIQAGAATAGFLTAITLRFAGYRLLNHRSEWLRPIAVSG